MAKERNEAKTYRRVPGDLEEVSYIAKLIAADVEARAPELAKNAASLGELQRLLNWREKWQGMLADLREDEAVDEAAEDFDVGSFPRKQMIVSSDIAFDKHGDPIEPKGEAAPKPNRKPATAGGATKAPAADETK